MGSESSSLALGKVLNLWTLSFCDEDNPTSVDVSY